MKDTTIIDLDELSRRKANLVDAAKTALDEIPIVREELRLAAQTGIDVQERMVKLDELEARSKKIIQVYG